MRYGVVIPVDGVLRNPRDDGLMLDHVPLVAALRSMYAVAFLADRDNERMVERWLMINRQPGYIHLVMPSTLFPLMAEPSLAEVRMAQIAHLVRAGFPVSFYLDTDATIVDRVRKEFDTILLPGKPDVEDFSRAPVPWDDLLERLQRENAEQSLGFRVDMEEEGRFHG